MAENLADLGAKDPRAALLDRWFAREYDEEGVWAVLGAGPPLAEVVSRLSTVPRAFLAPEISLRAIAGDLRDGAGHGFGALLDEAQAQAESRRAGGIVLWLLASEELVGPIEPTLYVGHRDRAFAALAFRLAAIIDPADWLSDAQRREEAARLFLLWSGYLPAGENAATARSLWERLDSLRRNQALIEMLADHQHRVEVMRRLREKQAMEAAARYTHE